MNQRIDDWDTLAHVMHMRNSSQEAIASVIHEEYIITPLTRPEFTELWCIEEWFFDDILSLVQEDEDED
jgi:hypothetical protein